MDLAFLEILTADTTVWHNRYPRIRLQHVQHPAPTVRNLPRPVGPRHCLGRGEFLPPQRPNLLPSRQLRHISHWSDSRPAASRSLQVGPLRRRVPGRGLQRQLPGAHVLGYGQLWRLHQEDYR